MQFAVTFDNILAPGRYEPVANLAHRGSGHDLMDRWAKQMTFVVRSARTAGGLVDIPADWTIERLGADAPVGQVG